MCTHWLVRMTGKDINCDDYNGSQEIYSAMPEIGRELCRIKRMKEKYGYRQDILTENLNEREKAILICKNCQGIMKEACITQRGGQYCSCCSVHSKKRQNLSVREMINSLKCLCPLIERGCQWSGTLEDCENHLDTCGYVYETCKLNCGEVLRREELERHEKENCSSQVKCDHCDENFIFRELNGHLEKCPRMKVSCDLCGTKITREEMEQHLKHDCGMVQETCKLGCGVELTRGENSNHLKECPLLKVTCYRCSVEKYRKDMTQHLRDHCPEKILDCPFVKYKCLERMKRKDIDKHLEEKETKHLGLKLAAMEDLITQQSEIIDKLSENIEKQNEQMTTEFSQQIQLLYSITDTAKAIWKIEDVKYHTYDSSITKQYEVAGHSFAFKFQNYGSLSIVFPGTTMKLDSPFIAKCRIALHSRHTINCGIIEVKQKDVTRGCERIITYIPQEDIEKYSEYEFPGATKKDLILEIFIIMQ